jgi:hypothetical protein
MNYLGADYCDSIDDDKRDIHFQQSKQSQSDSKSKKRTNTSKLSIDKISQFFTRNIRIRNASKQNYWDRTELVYNSNLEQNYYN